MLFSLSFLLLLSSKAKSWYKRENSNMCRRLRLDSRLHIHLIWRFTTRFELGLFSRKVNDFHPSTFLYFSISILYLVIQMLHSANHKKRIMGNNQHKNMIKLEIVENLCLVRLLHITADFGVKTNAKFTPIIKLREKRKRVTAVCTE